MKLRNIIYFSMVLLLLVIMPIQTYAQVATVDGIGGIATGDIRYPTSYKSIIKALEDVKLPGNDVAPGNTIRCTTDVIDVTAGLMLNTVESLTIESNVSGGTHLRINPTGIGIGAASVGIVAVLQTGEVLALSNLIITPATGAAGEVAARGIQCYNAAATTNNATFEVTNCFFTAIRPTGHPQAGQPVLTPLTHGASADTIAARNAELRSFTGGGGNNVVELRANVAPTAGNVVYYNFTNTVFTHTVLTAAASRGGGIVISRTRDWVCNINGGCVFSFNAGSGIRVVGTMAAGTTFLNVNGTASNPVIFYKNGWMEDTANTARNEGIQNDSSIISINHAYFVENFQEGIDKLGSGAVTIQNSYFANNQKDLDVANGTPPDVTGAANLKLTSNSGIITMTNVTIFDDLAVANDNGISWTSNAAGGSSLSLINVVIAGAGDQITFGNATAASVFNATDVAFAQSGPYSLQSPYIGIGANITANQVYSVTDDPNFVTTVFAPVWNGFGNTPGGLTNYLAVNNTSGNYSSVRQPGASDVLGANPNGIVTYVREWSLY